MLSTLARTAQRSLLPVLAAPAVMNTVRTAAQGSVPSKAEPQLDMVDDRVETGTGFGLTPIAKVLAAKPDEGAWLWCGKDDCVLDAVKKMSAANVGSLLVFDPARMGGSTTTLTTTAVVGIFTERDYLRKVAVEGKSSKALLVSEVMTPSTKIISCTPEATVMETMTMMIENNFRHMPVVEKEAMKGMVSIRDLVKIMVKEHNQEVEDLKSFISGTY